MRLRFVVAVVVAALTHQSGAVEVFDEASADLGEVSRLTVDPGVNTAECWRIKSLVKSNGLRDGFEWQVNSIKFYEEDDCSGTPLTGNAFSSTFQKNYTMDDPAGESGLPENAFGYTSNFTNASWIAKSRDAGEYVGLKLAANKEVKCIKVKQRSFDYGVRAATLEKSQDCIGFARVAEFPNFPASYDAETTFTFPLLDVVPDGVFQIRSRHDVGLCIAPKVPTAEEPDVQMGLPQKSFDDGAELRLQMCNIKAIPQFWFRKGVAKKVFSAKDVNYVITIPDAEATGDPPVNGAPTEDGSVIIKVCENQCPNLNSGIKLSSITGDGLLLHKDTSHFILAPFNNTLAEGTRIVTTACGTSASGGELSKCSDKTNAQFDLVPLFTVLAGRKAVNCAPYSHSHPNDLAPMSVGSEQEAQQICAADETCRVYMYVSPTSPVAPDTDKGKAWFCTKLDVVYSGKTGYSLGFRALNANEEEMLMAREAQREEYTEL